jgi:hypothetical protein
VSDVHVNVLLSVKLLFTDSDAVGFCVHLSDHVTSLIREVLRGALRNPNSGIHCNKLPPSKEDVGDLVNS